MSVLVHRTYLGVRAPTPLPPTAGAEDENNEAYEKTLENSKLDELAQ